MEIRSYGTGQIISLDLHTGMCNWNSADYIKSSFAVRYNKADRHTDFESGEKKNGFTQNGARRTLMIKKH